MQTLREALESVLGEDERQRELRMDCPETLRPHEFVTEHVNRNFRWVPLTFCRDCKVVLTDEIRGTA